MIVTVPVLVQRDGRLHTFAPLFAPGPTARHENLVSGMAAFAAQVRKRLVELGGDARHEDLARYCACPEFEVHRSLEVVVNLRRSTPRCRFLFVSFRKFERRLAFTPAIPDLWFTVERGQELRERAEAALTEHFRKMERESADGLVHPERLQLEKSAWVTTVEVEFSVPDLVEREDAAGSLRAFLGGAAGFRGREELEKVGRCLDEAYPHGLGRAFFRDELTAELARLLASPRRRPILLLGGLMTGRTAILHECVRRHVERLEPARSSPRRFWHLAPQRLISGMSYVGQWQERVLAILQEAKAKNHVVCVDDLRGLFSAGISASSGLTVAQAFKPFLERGEVQLVAEATREEFRVVQELDRGFADLFHVLPVGELGGRETLTVLVRRMQELEGRDNCVLAPQVVPQVLDLQRRHARHLGQPGKAVAFLEGLTSRHRSEPGEEPARVGVAEVLSQFQAASGLCAAFVDDRIALPRREVLGALARRVVGQEQAIAALADIVGTAKARLNDPGRPLGSLLFLGPTGVGKTQCARALADFLFGDAERLLRLDMNEYGAAGAAARLAGTFESPDGTLTGAVSRAPFAVVLLDEIEKAHPEVFDLLLQVLDDGRLTDAAGRTVDFSGCIIVLTSNLGVEEAGRGAGFCAGEAESGRGFTKAAEDFFRPEFFNRLDRVVPFQALTRDQVRGIAGIVAAEALRREGFFRRKSLLEIDEAVLDAVAGEGYDAALGARPLKRAVERRIVRPVAARVSGISAERATVVRIRIAAGGAHVDVQGLEEARGLIFPPPGLSAEGGPGLQRRIEELLRRIDAHLPVRGAGLRFDAAGIPPAERLYFVAREQLGVLRERLEGLREGQGRATPGIALDAGGAPPRQLTKAATNASSRGVSGLKSDLFSAINLHDALKDLRDQARIPADAAREAAVDLFLEAGLLDRALSGGLHRGGDRALLVWERLGIGTDTTKRFVPWLLESASESLLLWQTGQGRDWAALQGAGAADLLALEAGTHIFTRNDGSFSAIRLAVAALGEGEDAAAAAACRLARLCAEPLPPVVRVYDEGETSFDVRSGILVKSGLPGRDEHRRMLLSQLPLPQAAGGG